MFWSDKSEETTTSLRHETQTLICNLQTHTDTIQFSILCLEDADEKVRDQPDDDPSGSILSGDEMAGSSNGCEENSSSSPGGRLSQ